MIFLIVENQPQNPEFRNNPENVHPCTLLKPNIASVTKMHEMFQVTTWQNETNKPHIMQQFYLLTKTWKYGGSVFGKDGARSSTAVLTFVI